MNNNLIKFLSTTNELLLFPFNLKKSNRIKFIYKPYRYFSKLILINSLIYFCQICICYGKMRTSRSLNEIIFVGFTFLIEIPLLYSTISCVFKRESLKELIETLQLFSVQLNKMTKIAIEKRLNKIIVIETFYLVSL